MLAEAEKSLNEKLLQHQRFNGVTVIVSEIPSSLHGMDTFIHLTCDIDLRHVNRLDFSNISVFLLRNLRREISSKIGYEIIYRFMFRGRHFRIFKISLEAEFLGNVDLIEFNSIFDRTPAEGINTTLYIENISKCLMQIV